MNKQGKQYDVFISYSRLDEFWVDKLKSALERHKIKVWIDKEQIAPGDRFVNVIEMGIKSSHTMVLVVSPQSMASGWVEEEYHFALSLSKDRVSDFRLIPVVLKDAELPGFLKSRVWVDFRDENDFDKNIKQLISGIKKRDKSCVENEKPAHNKRLNEISSGSFEQAAAVCYRIKDNKIEFLLIRSSGRRWIFPKGKIESGELPWMRAKQEAHDEAGVSGKIEQNPLTTFKHIKRDLKKKGREMIIAAFLLKIEMSYASIEKFREPTWFTPEEALIAVSEDRDFFYAEELKRVINQACCAISLKKE